MRRVDGADICCCPLPSNGSRVNNGSGKIQGFKKNIHGRGVKGEGGRTPPPSKIFTFVTHQNAFSRHLTRFKTIFSFNHALINFFPSDPYF